MQSFDIEVVSTCSPKTLARCNSFKEEVEANLNALLQLILDTNHLLGEVCEISNAVFTDAGFATL
jgi:hypothetical protein